MIASPHVSHVSPRIILSFTKIIRENPRDTQERLPVYPPLPPPFQEGAQFACHAIQVPPFGKGRLGGDGQSVLAQSTLSKERAGGEAFYSAYHSSLHGLQIRYVKILVIRRRGYLSILLYLPLSKREHTLLVMLFRCLPVVRGG